MSGLPDIGILNWRKSAKADLRWSTVFQSSLRSHLKMTATGPHCSNQLDFEISAGGIMK
jgi:hypothetical protein